MKRMKLIGLSLLAIFALGVLAAATASAEEGFLPTQASATALGGESTLEAAGAKIVCKTLDESTVKLENEKKPSDKHGTGTLHWLGCKAEKLFAVQSLGSGKEEILIPVLFLVCLKPANKEGKVLSEFGIAAEVTNVHLEVPAAGILQIVNGRVIATVTAAAEENKVLFPINFTAAGGVQEVQSCVENAETKKHSLTSLTNEKGEPAPATENVVGGLLQFKEKVKLMDS